VVQVGYENDQFGQFSDLEKGIYEGLLFPIVAPEVQLTMGLL